MAEFSTKLGGARRTSTGGRRADDLPVGTTQRRPGTSPAPHGRAPCMCRAAVLCGASLAMRHPLPPGGASARPGKRLAAASCTDAP